MELYENALQTGGIWKRRDCVQCARVYGKLMESDGVNDNFMIVIWFPCPNVFLNHKSKITGLVWTANIWCIFRVKKPFSNFSADVEWMTGVSTSILFDFMYLSIEWEGTGKYLARGQYVVKENQIFFRPALPLNQKVHNICCSLIVIIDDEISPNGLWNVMLKDVIILRRRWNNEPSNASTCGRNLHHDYKDFWSKRVTSCLTVLRQPFI